jgi:4-hydroxy-tetrahydrodipicolinate reductase
MAVDIIVTGALGRMGQEIARIACADESCGLSGATEAPGCESLGRDIGELVGCGAIGAPLVDAFDKLDIDNAVIIDFTAPQATMQMLSAIEHTRAAAVIGTTGLDDSQRQRVERAAQTRPILMSPNMGLGVNILFYLVNLAARRLASRFDIEIVEAHHRMKKDAPSGTARRLGEIVADALGLSYDEAIVDGRSGMVGQRPDGQVGMHAVRGGDIVGDHTVLFAGPGERIELKHVAHSRSTFAQGAVEAAKWLSGKPSGLYSMQDMLDL